MNRCKTCKHWESLGFGGGVGTCDSPKTLKGYHTRITAPDQILVEGDEGWGLVVGPDFGCVNHESDE